MDNSNSSNRLSGTSVLPRGIMVFAALPMLAAAFVQPLLLCFVLVLLADPVMSHLRRRSALALINPTYSHPICGIASGGIGALVGVYLRAQGHLDSIAAVGTLLAAITSFTGVALIATVFRATHETTDAHLSARAMLVAGGALGVGFVAFLAAALLPPTNTLAASIAVVAVTCCTGASLWSFTVVVPRPAALGRSAGQAAHSAP